MLVLRYRHRATPVVFRNGDLLAFEDRASFISKLIRARTSERISHVGLACTVRFNGSSLIGVAEAREGKGVRVFPLRKYLASNPRLIVRHYRLDTEMGISEPRLLEFIETTWGARYASWLQFLRNWGWISRMVADFLSIPKDVDQGDRFYCSEWVLDALRYAGYRGLNVEESKSLETGEAKEPIDVIENDDFIPSQSNPGDCVYLPCFSLVDEVRLVEVPDPIPVVVVAVPVPPKPEEPL